MAAKAAASSSNTEADVSLQQHEDMPIRNSTARSLVMQKLLHRSEVANSWQSENWLQNLGGNLCIFYWQPNVI